MSLATLYSRGQSGINAPEVTVEVYLSNGLPSLSIVGLPETAVKESKDRVRGAVLNSRFEFPTQRITINLAPADLPKDGGRYDLAIALGILAASVQIPATALSEYEFAARNLLEVCSHLLHQQPLSIHKTNHVVDSDTDGVDLADVHGQHHSKRALQIAAAGGHRLLLIGPPGTGKTMLACRLPSILPPMSELKALETASIHSIGFDGFDPTTWRKHPFRSPHHTASAAALVGGGSQPRPGEISLAHNGVLFLDELPAAFQLIMAMNPCPCGYLGSPLNRCQCTGEQISRYRNRISGPLLDHRIDMDVEVPALPVTELMKQEINTPDSRTAREGTYWREGGYNAPTRQPSAQ